MNSSKNLFRLTQLMVRQTARNASTDTVPSGRYASMKARQKVFETEDDVLVHLKGGFLDRVMYLASIGMVVTGSVAGLHAFYKVLTRK